MKTALLKHEKWCSVFDQVVQKILAPGLSNAMEYAVGVRVLAGNGVTVIANRGNPAGQTILVRFFPGGIAPLGLLGICCRLPQFWSNSFYVRDDLPGKT